MKFKASFLRITEMFFAVSMKNFWKLRVPFFLLLDIWRKPVEISTEVLQILAWYSRDTLLIQRIIRVSAVYHSCFRDGSAETLKFETNVVLCDTDLILMWYSFDTQISLVLSLYHLCIETAVGGSRENPLKPKKLLCWGTQPLFKKDRPKHEPVRKTNTLSRVVWLVGECDTNTIRTRYCCDTRVWCFRY